jgi:hypothetical protein
MRRFIRAFPVFLLYENHKGNAGNRCGNKIHAGADTLP